MSSDLRNELFIPTADGGADIIKLSDDDLALIRDALAHSAHDDSDTAEWLTGTSDPNERALIGSLQEQARKKTDLLRRLARTDVDESDRHDPADMRGL